MSLKQVMRQTKFLSAGVHEMIWLGTREAHNSQGHGMQFLVKFMMETTFPHWFFLVEICLGQKVLYCPILKADHVGSKMAL